MKPSDLIENEIEAQTELYIKREDIFEVATSTTDHTIDVDIDGNTINDNIPTNTVMAPTNQTMLDNYEIVIREGKETITLYPDTFHKLFNPVLQTSSSRIFSSSSSSLSSSSSSAALDTQTQKISTQQFLHVTTAPPVAAPPPADWQEEIEEKYPNILDSNELNLDSEEENDEIDEEIGNLETITENFMENFEDYEDTHLNYRKIYSRFARFSV